MCGALLPYLTLVLFLERAKDSGESPTLPPASVTPQGAVCPAFVPTAHPLLACEQPRVSPTGVKGTKGSPVISEGRGIWEHLTPHPGSPGLVPGSRPLPHRTKPCLGMLLDAQDGACNPVSPNVCFPSQAGPFWF